VEARWSWSAFSWTRRLSVGRARAQARTMHLLRLLAASQARAATFANP
jgi:hypothetical protein